MLVDVAPNTTTRNKQRSIAISWELLEEIRKRTKGYISTSSFIRMAVINELERIERKKDLL